MDPGSGSAVDFQKLLRDNYEVICRSLVVSRRFLMKLTASEFLAAKTAHIIITADDKTEELLSILSQISPSQAVQYFPEFLAALRQDGQDHVANVFLPESDERPMSDEHYRLIVGKRRQLCQFLDPVDELVDELFNCNVFSDADRRRAVSSRAGYDEKAHDLLDAVVRKSDAAFESFVDALNRTNQAHVAQILTGHGEPPMSESRLRIVREVRDELVKCIDLETSRIVDRLVDVGVLNTTDRRNIEAQPTEGRQIGSMLHALERKSNCAFDMFLRALKDTGQEHIALELEGLEIRGHLEAHFRPNTSPDEQLRIVRILTKFLHVGFFAGDEESVRAITALAEEKGFAVSDIAEGSIRITFRCYGEPSLTNLRRLCADRTFDRLFTDVVVAKFAAAGLESLTLRVDDEEFERGLETFRQMALMTDERRETLRDAAATLNDDDVSITDEFLSMLSLCDHHMEAVRKAIEVGRPLKTLFGIVSRQPNVAFVRLVDALRSTQQKEVADILENSAVRKKSLTPFDRVPLELLETTLIQSYVRMFREERKTWEAVQKTYETLASVSHAWWQAMYGWPQSSTRLWFRHELRKTLKRICHPYALRPRLQSTLPAFDCVRGVAWHNNELFVICAGSDTVFHYGSDNEPLANIVHRDMKQLRDIVACAETKRLYVAGSRCVWMVSLDEGHRKLIVSWLPSKTTSTSKFSAHALSTRLGLVLVTSNSTNELFLYGSDGDEINRVLLSPTGITDLRHAVETSRGTFVVIHNKPQPGICEVGQNGLLIAAYKDAREQLGSPRYLAVDSDGWILVAEFGDAKHRVMLLDTRLRLERVLISSEQHGLAARPWRHCYVEQTGKLLVGSDWGTCIQVFHVRSAADRLR